MGKKSYPFVGLFLILSWYSSVISQVNGNSSYFPLAIGNQWIYQTVDKSRIDTIAIVDTQRVNGKLYYAFKEHSYLYNWFRMDSNKVYIVDTAAARLDPSNITEYLIYDFSADTSESWEVPLKDEHIECEYGGAVTFRSKEESIITPTGEFNNCYYFSRIVLCRDAGRIAEWFANGTGRIAYRDQTLHGPEGLFLTYSNIITGMNDSYKSETIDGYELFQNYPNPFNPITRISYSIPWRSYITLKLYNLLGQEVKTLFEGVRQPGNYEATFNAKGLSSGVYFYRMQAENFVETKKLILLK